MRLLRPLLLPVALLVLLTAAVRVPLPFFVERPGGVRSLAESVTVDDAGPLDGDFLLTTVSYRRGTVFEAVSALFDPTSDFLPAEAFIPEGQTSEEYFAGQRSLFAATADVAAAVALAEAGYDVDASDITGDGARVVAVLEGAPAEGILEAGDVVVAVDGVPVTTSEALQEAVLSRGEEPLEVEFLRDGEQHRAELVPRLDPSVGRPVIGVHIETVSPRVDLPVEVEIDSGSIGGPSAGLLIALTVYDKVRDDVDLARGHRVAGTGTIDSAGRVGPVGSVEQKVVAAARADAEVFLVPSAQHQQAVGAVPADADMEVVPAATFDEAVAALELAFGG